MASRIIGARCGKALLLGLLAASVVYALIALTRVAKVDLPFLQNSRLLGRLPSRQPGGGTDNSSHAIVARLQEQIRVLEAKLDAETTLQKERKEAVSGKPLNKRARRVYTGLTTYPFKEDPHYEESPCPKKVSSIAHYSKWFMERYRPRVKLFLDGDDIANFTDIAKDVLPFGYQRESKELLKTIINHPSFTNAPLHPPGSRKQCLRCAVVGCGGILKDSGAGPEIDSHDYVFRLNHAVSAGKYEMDVGRKTSFYIFFPESMGAMNLLDKEAKYIYTMFKTYDMNYAVNMLNIEDPPNYIIGGNQRYRLAKPNVDPAKLKIVHPDFFRYVFAEYLDAVAYRPTTGAMVVFLALHICDEVTIYGFGYDPRFTMHYYDKNFVKHTDVSTGSHDVDNERHLWQKLHEEGVIRLFKRDIYTPHS